MNGSILGHEVGFALREHLLGEVGILDVHEIVLVEAADGPERAGAHAGEAAGAELDGGGFGQVGVLHEVGVVVLRPELEAGKLPVDHGPQGAPAERQLLGAAIREDKGRAGHHGVGVLRHPVGKVAEGVRRELDVRVQDEVEVTVQLRQNHVVPGAEAAVFGAAVEDDLLARPCRQRTGRCRCAQLFPAAVGAGIVYQIEGERVAAGIL